MFVEKKQEPLSTSTFQRCLPHQGDLWGSEGPLFIAKICWYLVGMVTNEISEKMGSCVQLVSSHLTKMTVASCPWGIVESWWFGCTESLGKIT